MSGICALYGFGGRPVEARPVDRMLAAMEGWGQGPGSTWREAAGRAALACRFMPVTPEDRFDGQPIASKDGTLALVADARIDNRSELADEWGVSPAEAARLPDSAFIMEAYRAWGEDCARRLIGDFAFLLWDGRRRVLFGARDPLGQRVLYHHASATSLAVASSVHALLAREHMSVRLNEQKIAELLVLLEDGSTTCYEGVQRLPAGHVMVVTPEGVGFRRYWHPEAARAITLGSDGEYVEAFLDVFGRAVRDRLRSVRPVAIMISGGLDSSSVAAMAAHEQRGGDRLLAYHAAPRAGYDGAVQPGWVVDESADVQALAAMHPAIELTILRGQDGTPLDDAPRLFDAVGAPIRNSISLTWIRMLYERAAARGAGVMLNGGKGNFTISYTGLRAILDAARAGRVVDALREVRAVALRRGHRPRDVLRYQILEPLMPRAVQSLRRRLGRTPDVPIVEASHSAIRPEFAAEMRVAERARALHDDDGSQARATARAYRIQGLTATGDAYDAYHAFRSWFPIETREVPSDVRVIDFCLGIPNAQYLRHGHDRQLIRRSMRDLLPASIRQRTTRGAQAADWPEWFGAMRVSVTAELKRLERIDLARRCLDLPRMQQLVDAWPASFGPEHTGDYPLLLLRGIMMGRFIRWFEERAS